MTILFDMLLFLGGSAATAGNCLEEDILEVRLVGFGA
jgi:hypothetical protein